jgi:hypothetical protein
MLLIAVRKITVVLTIILKLKLPICGNKNVQDAPVWDFVSLGWAFAWREHPCTAITQTGCKKNL